MKKKKVTIIGVGLIGGSLGIALKASRKFLVTGIGRHTDKLRLAKKRGAVDRFTKSYAIGVAESDIVVVATPVDLIAGTVKKIIPYLKKGAVVTDVGSVKGPIIEEIRKILQSNVAKGKNLSFVGAHPMAGSEKTGVRFAEKGLFKGATVVLVRDKSSGGAAFNLIKKMWQVTGAKIKVLSAKKHDKSVALISHLPHVIAFNLCRCAGSPKDAKDISSLLAGSFRDMTRVAGSNPRDWAAICGMNKAEVRKAIDTFIDALKETKNKLGDIKALERIFSKARSARLELLNNHGMDN